MNIDEITRQIFFSDEYQKIFKNEFFEIIELSNKDHDTRGKILKQHLIIEHFINEYIKYHYSDVKDLDGLLVMHFYKKMMLFKKEEVDKVTFDALKEFNSIRNKYSHDISFEVNKKDISNILLYLKSSEFKNRDNENKEIVNILEDFTFSICGFIGSQYGVLREYYLKKLDELLLKK